MSKTDSGPTIESLNLSASIFTSQIESWIPKDFGRKPQSGHTSEQTWQSIVQSTGRGSERLGLGHPQIGAPKAPGAHGYQDGLEGLRRTLKQDKRREGVSGGDGQVVEASNGSDDEDSRANMVGKRKRAPLNGLLGTKKGKKTNKAAEFLSTTAVNAKSTGSTGPEAKGERVQDAGTAQTVEAGDAGAQLGSVSPAVPPTDASVSPKKSKSARKRERRRLAKAAGAAGGT